MAEPWWKAGPQDLHRIEDRISSLYVERCHIDRDDNAVVLVNRQQTVHLPAAYLAVLLLGPGTRITHAATALLGDSGTAICWVGERGVRMYAAGLGSSRGSALIMRQAWLVTRPKERTEVARKMYRMRFPDEDPSGLTVKQMLGREGTRIRRLYKQHAERTGVPWTKRDYVTGDAYAAGDEVNRLLSAANAALYGICHAVITGLGVSPALGFVHSGSAISFVLDIADLYKADITIPAAFDLAAKGMTSEREARIAVRDAIVRTRLMPRIVSDLKTLLLPDASGVEAERNDLWAGGDTTVEGGRNWDGWDVFDDFHLDLIGPEPAAPVQDARP